MKNGEREFKRKQDKKKRKNEIIKSRLKITEKGVDTAFCL